MSDEWIKHDGGPCPVPPETWVQIKNKSGDVSDYIMLAACWIWSDVSAYRIFAPVSATPPADADDAFIRDTAARVLAALMGQLSDDPGGLARHGIEAACEGFAAVAVVAAEALAAKLKERKA